jgi:hypothetical protein
MDVTVVVGTYGDRRWIDLAESRALPSARAQGCPVIHVHGDTLAQARNAAIELAETTWVTVLDADDELAPGFCSGLLAGTADIRAPRLVRVDAAGRRYPVRGLPQRNIERLNPLPVCSLARRGQVLAAGGFREWPHWEDWGLWLTMVRRGATYEHLTGATYYWHVSADSRNRTVRNPRRLHRQIKEASW